MKNLTEVKRAMESVAKAIQMVLLIAIVRFII